MSRLNGRGKSGSVRIEYVIAAVICAALLLGMTAVLLQFRQRLQLATVSKPLPISKTSEPQQTQPRPEQPPQTANPPRTTSTPPHVTVRVEPPTPVTPAEVSKPVAQRSGSRSMAYPSGEPRVIAPGGPTRIEAKNFDLGGEGVAYHDTTAENSGGTYRPDEGVDISLSQDSEGEHAISFIRKGEWMNYTIRVRQSGPYRVLIRAARREPGEAKLRILFDGSDKLGDITLPNTGDYYKYNTTQAGTVHLSAGIQVMRVEAVTDDYNLNWIELVPADVLETAQSSQPSPAQPSRQTGAVVVRVQPIEEPKSQSSQQSSQSSGTSAGMSLVVADNFDDVKIGTRPTEATWNWSSTGSVTVQQAPGGTERCLRLVDVTRTGDCWVRQTFSEQKDAVVWRGRVRFSSVASEYGVSLADGEKQAVFIYTQNNEIGYENDGGKWQALAPYEANTWYSLRIEANIKDKNFKLFVDDRQAGGDKLKFRNGVPRINAWIGGTSPQLTGTMYIDSIKIEGR